MIVKELEELYDTPKSILWKACKWSCCALFQIMKLWIFNHWFVNSTVRLMVICCRYLTAPNCAPNTVR